jgi:hypothetical protein
MPGRSARPGPGFQGSQCRLGQARASLHTTMKSNCCHTKTEAPITKPWAFFPFFHFLLSSFPIWLKISHFIRLCLIFMETHSFLTTSNKGGNSVTFSILCCPSSPWLPTALVAPGKRASRLDRPLNWPLNRAQKSAKISLKISPNIGLKLHPELAFNEL